MKKVVIGIAIISSLFAGGAIGQITQSVSVDTGDIINRDEIKERGDVFSRMIKSGVFSVHSDKNLNILLNTLDNVIQLRKKARRLDSQASDTDSNVSALNNHIKKYKSVWPLYGRSVKKLEGQRNALFSEARKLRSQAQLLRDNAEVIESGLLPHNPAVQNYYIRKEGK